MRRKRIGTRMARMTRIGADQISKSIRCWIMAIWKKLIKSVHIRVISVIRVPFVWMIAGINGWVPIDRTHPIIPTSQIIIRFIPSLRLRISVASEKTCHRGAETQRNISKTNLCPPRLGGDCFKG